MCTILAPVGDCISRPTLRDFVELKNIYAIIYY